ncbi:MAG: ABC transporter ATP-binding protein [Sphaerochaetaceae bacterium]
MFLQIKDLDIGYVKGNNVVNKVNFSIDKGQIVSIVGSNGAGKSTILKCIAGTLKQAGGEIWLNNEDIGELKPQERVKRGLALVPEGKRLFSRLTVKQNLILGAYTNKSKEFREEMLETIYNMFPVIGKRSNQISGTLSGGEQQMLALGRALMSSPKLLMLDEPSLGIMPSLVKELFDAVVELNKKMKISILLVEQNVHKSIEIADKVYVLQTGKIVQEGGKELANDDSVRKAFLGI